MMKFKPIITEYLIDSSYVSTYFALDNTLIHKQARNLVNRSRQPVYDRPQTLFSCKIGIESEKVNFESTLNWDQDGQEDDRYKSVQVKII